jgi:hypothetical protein
MRLTTLNSSGLASLGRIHFNYYGTEPCGHNWIPNDEVKRDTDHASGAGCGLSFVTVCNITPAASIKASVTSSFCKAHSVTQDCAHTRVCEVVICNLFSIVAHTLTNQELARAQALRKCKETQGHTAPQITRNPQHYTECSTPLSAEVCATTIQVICSGTFFCAQASVMQVLRASTGAV